MENIIYESFEKFVLDINTPKGKLFNLREGKYIFRGESSLTYKLLPTALRDDAHNSIWKLARAGMKGKECEFSQVMGEFLLLSDFFKKCDENGLYIPNTDRINSRYFTQIDLGFLLNSEVWLPSDLYELAGLAQHYGVPTRLIDWTKDIFVALYFACIGVLKNKFEKEDRIVIWVLNSTTIQTETDSQLKIIKPIYKGNPNLAAQQGVFTMWEINKPYLCSGNNEKDKNHNLEVMKQSITRETLDKLILNKVGSTKKDLFYKIEIPNPEAKTIYKYLSAMRYNASRLFPGYDGVRRNMEEDFFLFDNKG